MPHKFEIFMGGCELCRTALQTLKEAICDKCEVIEYDLTGAPSEEVLTKVKNYNIKAVPAIVIDGKLEFEHVPSIDEIKAFF
ncbi:MAG: thioredoxin family protein [Candidatus Heimdallarchaeota archaeon]|nr:thioredoxin family protein [Candidatus Heimdallarchaeota archaeon]